MPRTVITPQKASSAGLAASYEPANASGNSFKMQANRALHVKNASGASITVTIPTPLQIDGLDVAERTITVAAGTDQFIALGTSSAYKQTGGVANVDYSAVTSVTVAVLDIP